MHSLRRRLFANAGLLVGLQVLGTALGFASWLQVHRACEAQQSLAEEQAAVLQLASAAREVYVHQAHTLLERGPGHLDHLHEVAEAADERLREAEAMQIAPGVDLSPVGASLAASRRWFDAEVVPAAQGGTLTADQALALHGTAERLSSEVEGGLATVLDQLAAAQTAERERVSEATARAWMSVAVLTIGGAGLGILVARRLGRAVVGPVSALRAAAAAFGEGRAARAPEEGDDELAELGVAFNRMVEKVGEAERRRLEVERLAALGEMSGAVAHELLNPLSVILGEPAMRQPELAGVRAEAEHARRVVQGMLGFARPGEEAPVRLDVREAARAAVDRITCDADMRDVMVRLENGPPVTTLASPSAVRQVLDNLLRNALFASAPGGCIEVDVKPGPVIEVRDRGPGIPASVRPRLYQPFVTARPDGTGLGLAVCQRIARAQGGSLVHLDREGGGTVAAWRMGGVDA